MQPSSMLCSQEQGNSPPLSKTNSTKHSHADVSMLAAPTNDSSHCQSAAASPAAPCHKAIQEHPLRRPASCPCPDLFPAQDHTIPYAHEGPSAVQSSLLSHLFPRSPRCTSPDAPPNTLRDHSSHASDQTPDTADSMLAAAASPLTPHAPACIGITRMPLAA